MPNFYLDIETTGTDPQRDKIITIQFVELERNTARKIGPLRILKEWESNEKDIIATFIQESGISDPYPFRFIPIGYNLGFEHKFLWHRSRLHGFAPINLLGKPVIDLRPVGGTHELWRIQGIGA